MLRDTEVAVIYEMTNYGELKQLIKVRIYIDLL